MLAVALIPIVAAQVFLGEISALLLLVLSPFLLFSAAAAMAKRNIVIRFAVVLGALFLLIDVFAFISIIGGKSTAPIGLAVLVLLQLVPAGILLIASLLAGRVQLKRPSDGTV